MRTPKPFSTLYRNDSKTFQITLKYTCGLPESVCAEWQRRSFLDTPEELSQYRRHLTGYILPRFGKLRFTEITPTAVEDFLLERLKAFQDMLSAEKLKKELRGKR
jgi:hypothetical protein